MSGTFSIFAAADIHAAAGWGRLREVLSLVSAEGIHPDAVLLGGDYVGGGPPPKDPDDAAEQRRWRPPFRLGDLHAEVVSVFGETTSCFFTYGSHDRNEERGRGFFCGPAELEACHLYGVSFCQMRFADDAQREAATPPYDGIDANEPTGGSAEPAAAHFLEWCASLTDHKPVLVMSHMPLQANRPDNRGAAIWCEALNAAAQSRDILVLYAHNHSAEQKFASDRRYYYVPAGSTMPVQGREKEERPVLPVCFTYLNAGYILNGCGTLLTFSGSAVTVRRFAANPADTAFGDTGYQSPLTISLRETKQ